MQFSSKKTHTAPAREAALAAFDRWSHVEGLGPIRIENNEHEAVFALVETLNQGPQIIRNGGMESIPAGAMVAHAVEFAMKNQKPFKGVKYACTTIRNIVEEWALHGLPGENNGRPKASQRESHFAEIEKALADESED